jgi:hypothetical protein
MMPKAMMATVSVVLSLLLLTVRKANNNVSRIFMHSVE